MGKISRSMMPVCTSLCLFCPSLSTRSRHPVKRYKKFLADIFPRSPDEQPNERMIGKLCEYASRNPLRIPKITTALEQRFYKDLRNEQFHSVKVILCVYRKLMISCKEQMPFFASSFLSIIQVLLDQTSMDETRVLGCEALFVFVNNQRDGTYMYNLDGLVPKLCQLAREMGEEKRVQHLRSAGLQTLSAMVWFMGEFSHVTAEFDNVVSVVLDNYRGIETADAAIHDKQDKQVGRVKDNFSSVDSIKMVSWRSIVSENGEVHVSVEEAENPKFWSRVCLHNMAKLAKEATTVRRVLESLFRFFDKEELWSVRHDVALFVLQDMQLIMENSGENTHFLLAILIKHLDHKNVLKKPYMQLDIVGVATSLAQQAKVQSSVAIIGALTDMTRHLRKSIHCSLDDSDLGAEVIQYNQNFRAAVDECLVQLSHKVDDAGPVLDMMSVMLENMPNTTLTTRALISAVYRTAQIMASIPNLSYQNKAFPEALFHQLLVAMVCTDPETRVGAHRIFSVVLVPSSVCPCSPAATHISNKPTDMQKTLSRSVSVFSSSAALFHKLGREEREKAVANTVGNMNCFSRKGSVLNPTETVGNGVAKVQNQSILNRLKSSYSRSYSVKINPSVAIEDEKSMKDLVDVPALPLRLSTHQITLILSSLCIQAIYPLNMPENFEAIAHTYSLVLLFARTKNSYNEAMIQSFQLAFTLRSISLSGAGKLQPSHRRSLYILGTCMILFSAKAFNIPPLVPSVKTSFLKRVDPFLQLVDDCKLQIVETAQEHPERVYGSKEDNEDALKSLSEIEITETQSKNSFAAMIAKFAGSLSSKELSELRNKLVSDFIPDDSCPVGPHLFMETPSEAHESESMRNSYSGEVEPLLFTVDDDVLPHKGGSQRGPETHLAVEPGNLPNVDQLLDALSETSNQVRSSSVSTPNDMPYSEMANHCQALLVGKQQRMSAVMNAQPSQESISSFLAKDVQSSSSKNENPLMGKDVGAVSLTPFDGAAPTLCAADYLHETCFKLPATNPYDNFLKAASC